MPTRSLLPALRATRGSPAARLAHGVALLLLLLQAVVVPAHRHAVATPAAQTLAVSGTILTVPAKQSPDPADCPVCREVAHAGQYLTPGGIALPVARGEALAPTVAALTPLAGSASSHSWRSRAPPVIALS